MLDQIEKDLKLLWEVVPTHEYADEAKRIGLKINEAIEKSHDMDFTVDENTRLLKIVLDYVRISFYSIARRQPSEPYLNEKQYDFYKRKAQEITEELFDQIDLMYI